MSDWDEEGSAPSFGSTGVSNGFGSGGGRGFRGFGNSNSSEENIPKKGFGRGGFGGNRSDDIDGTSNNEERGRKGFGRGGFGAGSNSDNSPPSKGFGRGGFRQNDDGSSNGWDEGGSGGGKGGGFGGGGGGGFSGGGDGEDQGGRGGGFSGRSGGGGSSSGCRKCGQEGHFARECPNKGSGGGACRKCGEEGHFARECPQGGGGGGGGACHKCGETGHFARECPQGGGGGGFSGGSGGFGGGGSSSKGGGFGSGTKSGGFGGGGGSFGNDNEEESSGGFGGGGGRRSGSGCHICGEEGHFARECPQKETKELDPNRPAPVTYVPPAPPESEEELFQSIHQGINFDKYDEIPVEVSGRDRVNPISAFEEANLYETFLQNVKRANYVKPTPVQKYSIPIILGGRDLMACAQTGSGKTAAFLLPVMTGMMNNGLSGSQFTDVQAPQAICIAPTRELAKQIHQEAHKFSFKTMLRAVVCYGGANVMHQSSQIKKGCHLLVATPGRLLDFVDRGKISLKGVKYLILDEADRMLDMGFEADIRKLVESPDMPNKTERQTLMFSATFPEEIQRLAGDFLNDYLFLTVGRVGATTSDIEQEMIEVSEFEKREKLTEILSNAGTDRTLVFVESKRGADFLASLLSQEGFPTTSIHGDRLQKEREEALEDFRRGRCPVLIATNVAARGLDINDVKHVINFDLPNEIDEYVHRIGRTGRIGHQGKATSFFQRGRDEKIARGLVKVLSDSCQDVPEWLEECAEGAVGTDYGPAGGRFGSRDTRKQYGGNRGRRDDAGEGSFHVGEWNSNETSAPAVNGTEGWNTGEDDSWD